MDKNEFNSIVLDRLFSEKTIDAQSSDDTLCGHERKNMCVASMRDPTRNNKSGQVHYILRDARDHLLQCGDLQNGQTVGWKSK